MHLAPVRPHHKGPGLWRFRPTFARHRHLLQRLQDWVSQQAAEAPVGDDWQLLRWWPAFFVELVTQWSSDPTEINSTAMRHVVKR